MTKTFDKYPTPISMRSGAKVSWYDYDNLDDAKRASDIAKQIRDYKWDLGYDFGWLIPGDITSDRDGTRWTVVIP